MAVTRPGIRPARQSRQGATAPYTENAMGLGTILLIILILMLVGAIPTWSHSKSWGYAPSGVLGLIVVVLIVLLLMGRL